MSEKEVFSLSSENLENVSGGRASNAVGSGNSKGNNSAKGSYFTGAIIPHMVGGPASVWRPVCPTCGKVMPGGKDVIRISKKGIKSPYFCTECAEKFLNSGEAVIDKGYEDHYEKYEKSIDKATGEVLYGWRKKSE